MSKRKDGHVFVKTPSGLVIPFIPPALDIESSAERTADVESSAGPTAEREPEYLLTTPGQAWEGRIVIGEDGERELVLFPVDELPFTLPAPETHWAGRGPLRDGLPEA